MTKKNKASESLPGDKPRTSKRKTQQSAPLASTVSTVEKTTKPKSAAVAAEGATLVAEVSKGSSASNVAEEEQKMPALPKCAAVAREVIGARAVPVEQSVGVEAIKGQGVAGEKLEEAEENKDDDDDEDDSGGDDDEEEEKSDDEGSEYAPLEDGSEGTVILSDDAVVHIDNLPDVVKPSQKEKVSSPFDLPILPIAKTMLVKKGKKGNTIPDGDDDSILMLTDDEAKSATPSKQKKKVLATKSPPPGSASKVGTSASSEEALMMIKGCQELFFNLPWQNYVSVLFHLYFCSCKCLYT